MVQANTLVHVHVGSGCVLQFPYVFNLVCVNTNYYMYATTDILSSVMALSHTPIPPDPGYEMACSFYPHGSLADPVSRYMYMYIVEYTSLQFPIKQHTV